MPRFLRRSSAKKQADKSPTKGKTKSPSKTAKNPSQFEGQLPNGVADNAVHFKPLLAGPPPEKRHTKSLDVFKRNSQLSKALLEVLTDDAVLQYFMEFMQKQGARSLLTFWLAAETFRIATVSRYRAGSTSRLKNKSRCQQDYDASTSTLNPNGNGINDNGGACSSKVSDTLHSFNGFASSEDFDSCGVTSLNVAGECNEKDHVKNHKNSRSHIEQRLSVESGNHEHDNNTPNAGSKMCDINKPETNRTLLDTARSSGKLGFEEKSNSSIEEGLPSGYSSEHKHNGLDRCDDNNEVLCMTAEGLPQDRDKQRLTNGMHRSDTNAHKQTDQPDENDLDNESTSLLCSDGQHCPDPGYSNNNDNDQSEVDINRDDDDELCLKNEPPIPRTSSGSRVTFDLTHDGEDHVRDVQRHRTRSVVIDAVSIYSKYISLQASHPIGLDEQMRREIEMNICSEDGKIQADCFNDAQTFAFNVMNQRYFPSFQRSHYYCKHQIDVLTSGKVFLSDVLYNDTSMFYFMEYLELEGARQLLEFWLTADSLSQDLKRKVKEGQYKSDEALQDAMIVYDKFFSMQASCPLGVDDHVRIEIENRICQEIGPSTNCFDMVLEHCLALLEGVYFPSFLHSEIYYRYLTELLNSVSENEPTPTSQAEDDRSSTASENVGLTTFDSDWDLSDNPDAIWHRPNAGGLSLGRVNEFGIYQPLFEPEPDVDKTLSAAAKLSKAMRRLVSNGADKAKEEMAWKIAHMILDDVKRQQDSPDLISTDQQPDTQG